MSLEAEGPPVLAEAVFQWGEGFCRGRATAPHVRWPHMETRGNPALAGVVAALGALFVIISALYAFGAVSFATSDPGAAHHYKHALVALAIAVACLVAANVVRPKAA